MAVTVDIPTPGGDIDQSQPVGFYEFLDGITDRNAEDGTAFLEAIVYAQPDELRTTAENAAETVGQPDEIARDVGEGIVLATNSFANVPLINPERKETFVNEELTLDGNRVRVTPWPDGMVDIEVRNPDRGLGENHPWLLAWLPYRRAPEGVEEPPLPHWNIVDYSRDVSYTADDLHERPDEVLDALQTTVTEVFKALAQQNETEKAATQAASETADTDPSDQDAVAIPLRPGIVIDQAIDSGDKITSLQPIWGGVGSLRKMQAERATSPPAEPSARPQIAEPFDKVLRRRRDLQR